MPLPARTTTAWVHFPGIDAAIAPVRDLVDERRDRGRADGRPGADRRRLEHGRRARGVEGAAARVGGAAGRVRRRRATPSWTPTSPGRARSSPRTRRSGRSSSPATPRRSSWPGGCARGCTAWSGGCGLPGTALIVEDVCVPPERIAEGARDLQALLGEHGFLPGVAGHASAGNLHFMLTPDFAKQEDLERYESFMAKLVELIVDKYDGSLKAEHGTGINMAPYVEREWGEKATELMWRVKRLADPDGVLAPGVVLNRDPGAHLRNLKTTPAIEESATTCVECGFCEPVCPSRNLTTTPRQRIVLRREMARQPAGSPLLQALLEEYEYDALDTCAADGSCRLACPLGIDTGKLVKELRGERHTAAGRSAGAARGEALGGGREGLARGAARRRPAGAADQARRAALPGAARPARLPATAREGAAAVYVPSCTNRIFGRRRRRAERGRAFGRRRPGEALVEVSARAGLPVWIPRRGRRELLRPALELERLRRRPPPQGERDGRAALGLERRGGAAGRDRRRLLHPRRRRARARGCLSEENAERLAELEILDSVAWAHDRLLPALEVSPQGRLRHRPPDLRDPPPGPRPAAPRPRRRPRRRRLRRPLGHLLRLRRRSRLLPSRADRGGDGGPGGRARRPRLRRPPLQQPHLRDRPQPRHRRALRVVRLPARGADPTRSESTACCTATAAAPCSSASASTVADRLDQRRRRGRSGGRAAG